MTSSAQGGIFREERTADGNVIAQLTAVPRLLGPRSVAVHRMAGFDANIHLGRCHGGEIPIAVRPVPTRWQDDVELFQHGDIVQRFVQNR